LLFQQGAEKGTLVKKSLKRTDDFGVTPPRGFYCKAGSSILFQYPAKHRDFSIQITPEFRKRQVGINRANSIGRVLEPRGGPADTTLHRGKASAWIEGSLPSMLRTQI
jgi:hypothetical protein